MECVVADEPKGFVVNPKSVGFVLSLCGLAMLFYQATGYVVARDYRMDSIENQLAKQDALNEKMSDQITKLNENIIRLTVILSSDEKK